MEAKRKKVQALLSDYHKSICPEICLILSSSASEMPEDLTHLKKAVSSDCCYVLPTVLYIYRLRIRYLFQGITRLAFIAETSAAPIAMVEEMPAFCYKALLSSSLSAIKDFVLNEGGWFSSYYASHGQHLRASHFHSP